MKYKELFLENDYVDFNLTKEELQYIGLESTNELFEYIDSKSFCRVNPYRGVDAIDDPKEIEWALTKMYEERNGIGGVWFQSPFQENIGFDFLKLLEILEDKYDFVGIKNYAYYGYFTKYQNGCYLAPHTDGSSGGRKIALLMYFNKNYDSNGGACLYLKDTIISPEFGKLVLFNVEADLMHGVSLKKSGEPRYALTIFFNEK